MGIHIGLLDLEEECIRWKLSWVSKGFFDMSTWILNGMYSLSHEYYHDLVVTYFDYNLL